MTGAFAAAIAITVLPVFKKYSERMALWFLALAIAALSLAVVENGTVMSMLSLSKAYAASNSADPAAFEGLRGVVAASRNWAHFTHLVVGGSTFFVLYATQFRFALIPRALAAFGMAAVALQIATVCLPFFGVPNRISVARASRHRALRAGAMAAWRRALPTPTGRAPQRDLARTALRVTAVSSRRITSRLLLEVSR